MLDAQAIADIVVAAVKSATAPYAERIAVLEQRNADLSARVQEFGVVRDRLVAVEVKTAAAPVSDVAPVLERVAALQDRVVALEARPVPDSAPVLSAIREELKALQPRQEPDTAALTDVRERLMAVEKRAADDTLHRDMSVIREKVAVLEVKAPVPGPAGRDGHDGRDGKDGADGVGFDDVDEHIEDDGRVLVRKHRAGERVKEFRHKTGFAIYRGVYQQGRTYEFGDMTTWAGAMWHANETTTDKPGDSKAWTLTVKKGRDGRDGKDAVTTPVVSLGAR